MSEPAKIVEIDYTNWRGERAKRLIVPLAIRFDSNEWHPTPQWLCEAEDCDTGNVRSFAMKDIHSWQPATTK